MIDKNLLENIAQISKNLDKIYKFENNEKIMYCSMKVSEEVWELISEVLKKMKIARKEKIDKFKQEDLEWEFADVIFSTLVLAESMNIDVNKALENKMNKIKSRWGI